jgi:Cu/Ag efflux protein CusF
VFRHVGFFRFSTGEATSIPVGSSYQVQAQLFISKSQRARGFQTRSFTMKCLTKWLSATLAIALLASTAAAVDTVANGKVKSVDADNKTLVLTDSADKDHTIKFDDKLIVNRAGKEGKSDLKVGDAIHICYDKDDSASMAHYVLVREGKSKNCELIRGSVKNYDADKNELTFTNDVKRDSTYSIGKAMVRVNMENAKIDSIKTGDTALIIVDTVEGKSTLRSVMVHRAK